MAVNDRLHYLLWKDKRLDHTDQRAQLVAVGIALQEMGVDVGSMSGRSATG
jgi:hypothetical protein